MLQELPYLGPEQKLWRLFSSICVPYLNGAGPATFMMQIEQWLKKMREISHSEKSAESQNYFRTQIEQLGRI
jgi:hypothetical protein